MCVYFTRVTCEFEFDSLMTCCCCYRMTSTRRRGNRVHGIRAWPGCMCRRRVPHVCYVFRISSRFPERVLLQYYMHYIVRGKRYLFLPYRLPRRGNDIQNNIDGNIRGTTTTTTTTITTTTAAYY